MKDAYDRMDAVLDVQEGEKSCVSALALPGCFLEVSFS